MIVQADEISIAVHHAQIAAAAGDGHRSRDFAQSTKAIFQQLRDNVFFTLDCQMQTVLEAEH
ncbi:hypothetical protein [Tunturiibacter gelidiferens]|uniref:hypothetical protein n=1 Tax=Tunturiibacter gelidiferens TaxID=3069689 RepID=UPI003D9AE308